MLKFLLLSIISFDVCNVHVDNCDINLIVESDGVTGTPMSSEGFAFMWAGARAMYGGKRSKIAFEVKVSP